MVRPELAKREVGGYAFTGFGTGESEEEREALVRESLEHLDQQKPRMMSGLGSPDEVGISSASCAVS